MRLKKSNRAHLAHLSRTAHLRKKSEISRNTLARKHRGLTDSYAGAASARANLAPEQELELVKYIKQLLGEGLSPTRAMIKNFASFLAKKDVSKR
jgi:hypothetical protein